MKTLKLVGGIPTSVISGGTFTPTYYDEAVLVTTAIGVAGSGYDNTHTVFTLPNSETYDGLTKELQIEINGKGQHQGVDFEYENSATATTVTFYAAIKKNGLVRFRKFS